MGEGMQVDCTLKDLFEKILSQQSLEDLMNLQKLLNESAWEDSCKSGVGFEYGLFADILAKIIKAKQDRVA